MVRAGRQHDGRGYSAPLRSTHLALPICAGVRRPSRLEAPVRKGGGRSCTRRSTYRRGKASHGAVRGVWAQRGLGSGRAGPWARLASPGDTVLWRARSWMKSVDSTRVAEAISDWQSAAQASSTLRGGRVLPHQRHRHCRHRRHRRRRSAVDTAVVHRGSHGLELYWGPRMPGCTGGSSAG
jgi:hypothetical protein